MSLDSEQYKYDVAFSFLEQDESLAIQIDDLIKDRLSTFIYSKKQKEVAGRDGEKTFNEVFGKQSRIVVVCYRENWGNTPWSRIEETAIRNRAYNESYDFVLFMPIESSQKVPQWLPKTQIWIGLERWGITGAASVIEARVQSSGGTPREENALEFAQRKKRDIERIKARKAFLCSENGVQAAFKEIGALFSEVQKLCDSLTKTNWKIETYQPKSANSIFVYSNEVTLSLGWLCRWSNILDDSGLYIKIWKGRVGWPNIFHFHKPVSLQEHIYAFDTHDIISYGWKKVDSSEPIITSKQVAEFSIKLLTEAIHKQEIEEKNYNEAPELGDEYE